MRGNGRIKTPHANAFELGPVFQAASDNGRSKSARGQVTRIDRAALRKSAIFNRQLASRAIEQGLGDKKPEAEAGALARGLHSLRPVTLSHKARPMRPMTSGGKPGPSSLIVTVTLSVAPRRRYVDPLVREIDGVLQQVAEAVEDRRIARADRLVVRVLGLIHVDGDAEIAMRRRPRPRSAPKASCARTARPAPAAPSACRGSRGSAAPARAGGARRRRMLGSAGERELAAPC